MSKKFRVLLIIASVACGYNTAMAQYPRVPPAMQAKADSIAAIEKHRSDVAFEKAQVAMKIDEKKWQTLYSLGGQTV